MDSKNLKSKDGKYWTVIKDFWFAYKMYDKTNDEVIAVSAIRFKDTFSREQFRIFLLKLKDDNKIYNFGVKDKKFAITFKQNTKTIEYIQYTLEEIANFLFSINAKSCCYNCDRIGFLNFLDTDTVPKAFCKKCATNLKSVPKKMYNNSNVNIKHVEEPQPKKLKKQVKAEILEPGDTECDIADNILKSDNYLLENNLNPIYSQYYRESIYNKSLETLKEKPSKNIAFYINNSILAIIGGIVGAIPGVIAWIFYYFYFNKIVFFICFVIYGGSLVVATSFAKLKTFFTLFYSYATSILLLAFAQLVTIMLYKTKNSDYIITNVFTDFLISFNDLFTDAKTQSVFLGDFAKGAFCITILFIVFALEYLIKKLRN